MIYKSKPIYVNVLAVVLSYAVLHFDITFSKKTQQENAPPVVKILTPKNNSVFDFDSQINYQVTVSDKEDGNSKYDEINVKEVLLEVRYIANKSKLTASLNKGVQPDPPGLAIMRTSNCFNCHNFNSKAMGPSFYEINKKYPATKANTDTLVKHIRDGSSGAWAKEKMPTHPELTTDEIKSTVQWILKHAADADDNYFIGTEGTFRIKPPAKPNGAYLLTASYVDHGLKTAPGNQRLKGGDMVVIYGR
jgi:cytochrome c